MSFPSVLFSKLFSHGPEALRRIDSSTVNEFVGQNEPSRVSGVHNSPLFTVMQQSDTGISGSCSLQVSIGELKLIISEFHEAYEKNELLTAPFIANVGLNLSFQQTLPTIIPILVLSSAPHSVGRHLTILL